VAAFATSFSLLPPAFVVAGTSLLAVGAGAAVTGANEVIFFSEILTVVDFCTGATVLVATEVFGANGFTEILCCTGAEGVITIGLVCCTGNIGFSGIIAGLCSLELLLVETVAARGGVLV